MRTLALATALFVTTCHATPPSSSFDAAEQAGAKHDFLRARTLYHDAANTESDPERKIIAVARAANIEWRIMHDLTAARATLADATAARPLIERARAEAELAHDWTAAHEFAQRAIAAAKKRDERRRAIVADAFIQIRAIRDARFAHQCVPADSLAPVIASLRALVESEGPFLNASRALLNAAILTNDRDSMLQAWRWYYGSVPDVPLDRLGLGMALAKARLFDEAALVLDDPCSPALSDAAAADVVFYDAALRRVRDIAEEHYRRVSLGTADVPAFRAAIEREGRTLWPRFGDGTEFSLAALLKVLFAKYGTVATMGQTGGIDDLHLGHAVVDTTRTITQYGHTATIRFVLLDGIVSNGYSTFASDGGRGDGGWNNPDGIFQVRPMYADGPVRDWQIVADPQIRADQKREMEDEEKRDLTRDPKLAPVGMARRLQLEADDALLEQLKAKGLTGDALRVAFIERVGDETFQSSIVAHEGRHAIDAKLGIKDSPTLEYRAKLSEVAFAPSPRRAAIGGIFVNLDPSSAHGKANRQIFDGLKAWMKSHAKQITGFDESKPVLAQFDKLTDDQMREAFRSMDPLARR